MKMLMLSDMRASPDGFRTHYYRAGYEYDLPDMLARSFYADDVAVPVSLVSGEINKTPSSVDMLQQ
jgi:hypothetical protein